MGIRHFQLAAENDTWVALCRNSTNDVERRLKIIYHMSTHCVGCERTHCHFLAHVLDDLGVASNFPMHPAFTHVIGQPCNEHTCSVESSQI